jgi:hypothetical protein
MQFHFSTDRIAPRDRVRFWCEYFAKQAHGITPSEIPDPGVFRAKASGSIAGELALLDIKSGFESVPVILLETAENWLELLKPQSSGLLKSFAGRFR